MEKILSVKNDRVKQWKKLTTSKGRRTAQRYLIEGWHLVEEALRHAHVYEVLVSEEKAADLDRLTIGDVPICVISAAIAAQLAETETTQAVFAVVALPDAAVPTQWQHGQYCLLDNVQDPGNLGTIIRTADAAGCRAVILGQGCVDYLNGKVLRSMQGSHFHLPVYRADLLGLMPQLQASGIPVYATALDRQAIPLSQLEPLESVAWVFGNEGMGVSPEVQAVVDGNVYLPMAGQAESLNVAVAAGITLFYTILSHK